MYLLIKKSEKGQNYHLRIGCLNPPLHTSASTSLCILSLALPLALTSFDIDYNHQNINTTNLLRYDLLCNNHQILHLLPCNQQNVQHGQMPCKAKTKKKFIVFDLETMNSRQLCFSRILWFWYLLQCILFNSHIIYLDNIIIDTNKFFLAFLHLKALLLLLNSKFNFLSPFYFTFYFCQLTSKQFVALAKQLLFPTCVLPVQNVTSTAEAYLIPQRILMGRSHTNQQHLTKIIRVHYG